MIYTIKTNTGEHQEHASVHDAARFILSYDNHDWELRADDEQGGYSLWCSRFGGGGRKGGMVKNLIWTPCEDLAQAALDVLEDVARYSDRYGFDVLTEDEFKKNQAEMEQAS